MQTKQAVKFLTVETLLNQKRTGLAGLLLVALAHLAGAGSCEAATVWTGPRMTFIKDASSDPSEEANQDRITPIVWITRASGRGLYNAKTEIGFTHSFSPTDTE